MRNRTAWRPSGLGRATVCLLGLFLLAPAASALAQTSTNPPGSTPPPATQPSTQTLETWRNGMAQSPVPKQGCFTSAYPNTTWQEVPCGTAPLIPYGPAHGRMPQSIGNTNDVTASVTGTLSIAVGSFDNITGVTSETGVNPNTGQSAPNIFSLQLNTNTFSTPTCSGASQPAACVGWQQFVYSNTNVEAFIQYWLINWGTNACPSGWTAFGSDCFRNSNSVLLFGQADITQLGIFSIIGEAVAGGNDTMIMSTGNKLFAISAADNVVNLAQGWTQAEFNVFGDGNGTAANFNSGSSITIRTAVDNGSVGAPSCVPTSFTAETNNLGFAGPPTARRLTWPAVVFTETGSGVSAPCSAAADVPSGEVTDSHDFNGDGVSDLVWRDTSGNTALWLMNGAQVSQSGSLGAVPTTWSVIGQRDFQGVGKAALLWRDTSGDMSLWQMNGATVAATASLGTLATTWTLYGTGDLNGDGTGDLLWRDTAGDISIWLMSGSTISSSVSLGNVPTTWTIVGDDNRGDIFWHDNSGNYAVWQVNGGQVVQTAGLGNVPLATWQIAALGDFNGDGNIDILWRDTAGDTGIWFLNSSFGVQSTASLGRIAGWNVAQTGDYNGDGKTDIVWMDSAGDVVAWFMSGGTVSSSASLGNVGTTWTLQSLNVE